MIYLLHHPCTSIHDTRYRARVLMVSTRDYGTVIKITVFCDLFFNAYYNITILLHQKQVTGHASEVTSQAEEEEEEEEKKEEEDEDEGEEEEEPSDDELLSTMGLSKHNLCLFEASMYFVAMSLWPVAIYKFASFVAVTIIVE